MLSKKNAETGMFALSYTNTGKHLMGRTVSRAKTLPPRLRSQKYRRVDCCQSIGDVSTKKACFGNTTGIKKVAIRQLSYRNRLKRLSSIQFDFDFCSMRYELTIILKLE